MEFTKVDENSFDGTNADRYIYDETALFSPNGTKLNVSSSYFKILDKDGIEMPDHWTGRRRNYDEATKLLNVLNNNGEYKPYTMVEV